MAGKKRLTHERQNKHAEQTKKQRASSRATKESKRKSATAGEKETSSKRQMSKRVTTKKSLSTSKKETKKKTAPKHDSNKTPPETTKVKKTKKRTVITKKDSVGREKDSQTHPGVKGVITEVSITQFSGPFPFSIDLVAERAARVGGMFFVISGSLLSLLLLSVAFFPGDFTSRLVGQTISSDGLNLVESDTSVESTTQEETLLTTVAESSTNTTKTTQGESAPSVLFEYPDTTLTDVVQVTIRTSGASRVDVNAFYRDKLQYVTLGRSQKVDSNTWRYTWDTTKNDDGSYRLKAVIETNSGRYEISDDSYVFVSNNDTDTSESRTEEVVETSTLRETDPLFYYGEGQSTTGVETQVLSDNVSSVETDTESVHDTILTEETISPRVSFGVSEDAARTYEMRVVAETTNAKSIEAYVVPQYAVDRRFVGTLRPYDNTRWTYTWDTRNVPNGTYLLSLVVTNQYHSYESSPISVDIQNINHDTESRDDISEIEQRVSTIEEVLREVEEVPSYETVRDPLQTFRVDSTSLVDATSSTTISSSTRESTKSTPSSLLQNDLEALMLDREVDLKNRIEAYRIALRQNDEDEKATAAENLTALKERVKLEIDVAKNLSDSRKLELQTDLDERFARIRSDVERTERIVRERVGEQLSIDSDQDGITDYDELQIYKTNPKKADTDDDGFNDGVEIAGGFNPTDAAPEASIIYESPRSTRVVASDVLQVTDIVSVTPDTDDPIKKTVTAQAIVRGVGLPNSFVTLYIFSTPIVVTVKTADDGSWEYRFDKELEDGTHEVYVGLTDNTGSIVTKSEPFRFIKTAEAFEPVRNEPLTAIRTTDQPHAPTKFDSFYMLLIVLSISVVSIGVLLLLLGLYIKKEKTPNQSDVSAKSYAEETS